MTTYEIVRPIWGVEPPRDGFPFAGGVHLSRVPEWLSNIAGLGPADERDLQECRAALIVSYEHPPTGLTVEELLKCDRAKARSRPLEDVTQAHLALWISWPRAYRSPFTAEGHVVGSGVIPDTTTWGIPFWGHPSDPASPPSLDRLELAASLHKSMHTLPIGHTVLTALASLWSALHEGALPVRLLLMWIALESLFGPDDAREMSFRLAQRISFFHAPDGGEGARRIFAIAKAGYGFRSKVAHGRLTSDDALLDQARQAEGLVSQSFQRVLKDAEMINNFSSKTREAFLDDLPFRVVR